MDNRPVGVFDSGLGGLTVVKSITEKLPGEDIVFFGDTLRCPYGSRSDETILSFVKDDVGFLMKKNVKAIVIACNTADAHSLGYLEKTCPVPVLGVIEPAAKLAAAASVNGRIGVIGTEAAVRSNAYRDKIKKYLAGAEVFQVATPKLVPVIEEGHIGKDDPVASAVLREYLLPLKESDIDTLVLGCTHYPLLRETAARILPDVTLISSGFASTGDLIETLTSKDILNEKKSGGKTEFYVSGDPARFASTAGTFLNKKLDNIKKVIL